MSKHPFIKILAIVVGAIAGYAVVTSMREAGYEKSRQAQYNAALVQGAESLNRKLPTMLDADTRMDKVSTAPGRMNYFLSLPNQVKAELDLPILQEKLRQSIIANYKTNSVMAQERWNNVVLGYQYADKNGDILFEITISPNDF